MTTCFVVRETSHPEADLARNWSAPVGGFCSGDLMDLAFASAEDAGAKWDAVYKGEVAAPSFRFHPAYGSFVEVHYEGLGAWCLDADTLGDALTEAADMDKDFTGTMEAGDGHFLAAEVVAFHQVRAGLYIFEVQC